MFKAEAEGRSLSGSSTLVHSSGESLAPGGRKLKTVDSGMSSLFDDDEDGDSKRRREKEYGGDGDLDEQVYEEDFADDEEHMEVDENDEEAKETEVGYFFRSWIISYHLSRSDSNAITRTLISNVMLVWTNLTMRRHLG